MSGYLRRLPQRSLSILAVIAAWSIAYLGAPVWVPLALLADVVSDRSRMRWIRLYGLLLGQLTNEVVGLIVLFSTWLLAGFGIWMHSDWAERLTGRILGWWVHNVMAMVCFFMDTRLVFFGEQAVLPSPVLVLSRHISFLDAAIPAVVVTSAEPSTPRHVFMRELRFDPCIEICSRRSPNYLVDRRGGERELAAIERLGETLGPQASGVIFPEGGFRTDERFERALNSLQRRRPELAGRARSLRYVMPPRPGGTSAFLKGAEGVDVVVIAHAGFDAVSTVREIIAGCPISQPVGVCVRRIPRSEVPDGDVEIAEWLFAQFQWVDDVAAAYAKALLAARPDPRGQ